MNNPETYMQRCLDLARLGEGSVAPNPLVGAVLVHEDRIIGEGYHQAYGQAHAEPNCIGSVAPENRHLIAGATMYVSLEPCAHYGKTPPCAHLIIHQKIPRVVIACRDPFEAVNGKGIELLQAAGISLQTGVLEEEAKQLNKKFFVFHQQKRPYIILKWAETADGIIGNKGMERLLISNDVSNRLVHRWRSESAAILVGTNTAVKDNPSLTNRYWLGKNPVRLVIDKTLQLPNTSYLLDQKNPTIVFNELQQKEAINLTYQKTDPGKNMLHQILQTCYDRHLQSVLVEGGAALLQSFINAGLWDEARVIRNQDLMIGDGVTAPKLKEHLLVDHCKLRSDLISYYQRVV